MKNLISYCFLYNYAIESGSLSIIMMITRHNFLDISEVYEKEFYPKGIAFSSEKQKIFADSVVKGKLLSVEFEG